MPRGRGCECGCGVHLISQDSEFATGHAQRHAASLRRRAAEGDTQAFIEIYARGWNLNKGSSALNFGVEAEYWGIGRDYSIEVLRNAGINAEDDGYHHRPTRYWRITDDGSVSNEGNELVSPILRVGEPHFIETKTAVKSLADAGGKVDRSCGLHVHHSIAGKNVKDVAETVAMYALFQPIINTLLPSSRHEAGYARSISDGARWRNQIITTAQSMDNLRRNGHNFGRYHSVNLQALADHGTLEFRQHSGTLNHRKVTNWVRFTRALMDVSKFTTYQDVIDQFGSEDAARSDLGLTGMMDLLMLPESVKQFYVLRQEQLSSIPYVDEEDVSSNAGVEDGCETQDGEEDEDGRIWCSSCDEWHEQEPEY